MKRIQGIVALFTLLTFISCMGDSIQRKNREKYKPEAWFEGDNLLVAQAIYRGDTQEIEKLIKEKNLDVNGMSPNGRIRFLMYACILEDSKAAKKLLDLGADPNKVSPTRYISTDKKDVGRNEMPLPFAVARDNWKLTKLLLENGANPNTPIGILPIRHALKSKEADKYLDLLFQYGADANYPAYGDGKNSAQIAILGMKYSYISYFLDKGADPLHYDMNGRNLAYSLQKDLENFRGTEAGRKELERIKERLEKEYRIQFPVKRDYEKGARAYIQDFEKLPKEIKNLYGMEADAKFIKKIKDSLAVGKTHWGMTFEEVNNR